MTAYDLILEELERRKIANVQKFMPYFASSIGAHLFNLKNKEREIITEHAEIYDYRLHIFMIIPSGYGKTFTLSQFLDEVSGILGGTKSQSSPIKTTIKQMMTEAGFTGTVRSSEGGVVKKEGIAEKHDESIVGIGEFDALQNVMQQSHSTNIDNALLDALDRGFVRKDMAMDTISYKTYLTNWSGSQPTRFDVSQGLGRRYLFIIFIPNRDDIELYRKMRRRGKGVRPDWSKMTAIARRLMTIDDKLDEVMEIEYSDEIFELFNDLELLHYEEPLFERLAIGYHVMKENIDMDMHLTLTDELEQLIRCADVWRQKMLRGPHIQFVLEVLRDQSDLTMKRTKLREHLARFGIPPVKTENVLRECAKAGYVDINKSTVKCNVRN